MLFYGRLAILEPMVALFLTAGVVLLLSRATDRPVVRGVAAGAAFALAIGTKPSAALAVAGIVVGFVIGRLGCARAPPSGGRCRGDHRGRGSLMGDRRHPAARRARLDPSHLGRPGSAGLGDRRLATRRRLRGRVRPSDPHDRAPPGRLGARDRPCRGSVAVARPRPARARRRGDWLAGVRDGDAARCVISAQPVRRADASGDGHPDRLGGRARTGAPSPRQVGRGGGDRRAVHRRRTPGPFFFFFPFRSRWSYRAFEILDVGSRRIVSIVCSVATVAVVAAMVTRRLGAMAGIVAGIAMASSSLTLFYGRLAILEPMVALFLTAGVVLLLSHATDRPVVRGVAAGTAFALAIGTKPSAALAVAGIIVGVVIGRLGCAGAPSSGGRCRGDHRGGGSRMGDRRDPAAGRARLDPAHLGRPGGAGLGDRRLATRHRLRRRVRPRDPHDRAPPLRLGARDRPSRGSLAVARPRPSRACRRCDRLDRLRDGDPPRRIVSAEPVRRADAAGDGNPHRLRGRARSGAPSPCQGRPRPR